MITLDNDFSNQISYSLDKIEGIIILRPKTQGKRAVKELFERFLEKYKLENIIGKRIIVHPEEIKIRD